jgi:wobble nucleotide-excising tRNase
LLKRIENIQGIGLLHAANGKPHACSKATLVYADNGRGKSTLATVFRSVSTGDSSLITDRKTIDGTLPPKVVLQFENGHKVNFSGNTWSEQRPEVLVFDSDFIERNVYSGSSVSTGHRKNLLEFALGEPAVTARAAVDNTTAEARAAADAVQSLRAQLSGHHTGTPLVQFEKLPKIPDVDQQIEALQRRIVAAQNVATIVAKAVPKVIAEPSFDVTGLFAGLRTSLEDVHADAENIVKQHVHKLGGKTVESWLSQGRQLSNSDNCPYCDQNTSNNNLVRAYQSYFNAAYSALKSRIAALHNTVVAGTTDSIIDMFTQSVTAAKAEAAAWTEQVQTQPIEFDDTTARAALTELQGLVLELVCRKQVAPAESLAAVPEQERVTALWQTVVGSMQAANSTIQLAAAAITAYKSQLAGDSVQHLQQREQLLQASKRRHDAIVADLFGKLDVAVTDSTKAENAKKVERDNLDALMTKTLQRYEKNINALLKKFGVSFSIKGMGANFRGRAPRSEYGLLLRGKYVALEGGSPSFATTLSEGDKRTLAFAFFIASTLADTKLATRTVVVDDPMCSLDLNRKHHTKAVLRNLYAEAEQLIVFAHDPYFIRDLRDTFRKDNQAAAIALFQLTLAADEYTDFAPLDVDRECESVYFQHHRVLNDFLTGTTMDLRTVAKAIRPMLEGYLHRRFPRLIPAGLLFGQMVVLIRDSVATSPLVYAQNLVTELNEINEYARQFHHDTNPGAADTIGVVASELKVYVERSLHLVHSGAPLI